MTGLSVRLRQTRGAGLIAIGVGISAFAVCGLLDGLALSRFFNPEAFDHRELARYIKLFLREALSGTGKKKPALRPGLS